jgi:hypothetical protein
MSFTARIAALEPYETWVSMERAGDERFWDGLVLAAGSEPRTTGAVYLFGYAAEMILKVAYFRFTGLAAAQDIAPALRAARTTAHFHRQNLHYLMGWANLLIATRVAAGRPLHPVVAGLLQLHILQLQSHWSEVLRYRAVTAVPAELEEVYNSLDWLRANFRTLWS